MDSYNKTERREYPNYLVTDEVLLYRLADAGMLDKLCRVAPSRKVEGARVWFFDKDPDVLDVIKKYKAEKRAEMPGYGKEGTV